MKSFALMAAALALGFTLVAGDAEAARRLGGGKSSGMQREAVTAPKPANPSYNQAAPNQATSPSQAAAASGAAAAQPKRSWMGPVAGLAAGLGLAALASHFGFGEELASMLLIGLVIMAVLVVVGMIMRRRAGAQAPGMNRMQYAAAGPGGLDRARDTSRDFQPVSSGSAAPVAAAATAAAPAGNIPADFDVEGFVRNAKVNFIRLQAANDAGNLDDLREFMTPEMFGEVKMDIMERGQATQQTDVLSVDAEVLDVAEEPSRYVVSVRFQGQIRESGGAPESFDEVWNMVKPRDGSRGWVIAGIQQIQ